MISGCQNVKIIKCSKKKKMTRCQLFVRKAGNSFQKVIIHEAEIHFVVLESRGIIYKFPATRCDTDFRFSSAFPHVSPQQCKGGCWLAANKLHSVEGRRPNICTTPAPVHARMWSTAENKRDGEVGGWCVGGGGSETTATLVGDYHN